MRLTRYQDRTLHLEYEAVQLTPENMEEVAKHLHLEYVENYVDEEGGTEEALFRPGRTDPIHVGDFVVQKVNSNEQAYAVLAGDFDSFYKEIEVHVYVPEITYSDENYISPCVFCGNYKHNVPYHRDPVPNETITLPGHTKVSFFTEVSSLKGDNDE